MDKQYDLVCVGMALVDCLIRGLDPKPVSASGYLASSCTLSVGGEAVNSAVAAAKLGLNTGILCAPGQDAAGRLLRDALREAHVALMEAPGSAATPVSVLLIGEDGNRRSVTTPAHRRSFHPEEAPERFTCARAVLLGSLLRAPFDDPAGIHAFLKAARDAHQLVIADTKLPNFRFLKARDLRDSFPLIDWLTPNEDEARYLTGRDRPEDMARALTDLGAKGVLLKLGGRGCLMRTQEQTLRLPACAVRALDATGAGDHFAAGFVSELLRGKSAEEALRFANACGALCTTALGAGTALKDREQVLRFMADTPLNPPES